MSADAKRIAALIATEISARPEQAEAAIGLLDEGATVPFIARYRKEVTGGLDDTQLRTLSERLSYLRELDQRRDTILGSIREQGKLTPELETKIATAATKAELEDIYLPTSPNGAPRRRLRESAGWGRWQRPFWQTARRCRRISQRTIWAMRCRMKRPRWRARATYWPNSLRKTPTWLENCATT